MLILHDETGMVTGLQTFPETTSLPHIVVDDESAETMGLRDLVGRLQLVDNGDGWEMPASLDDTQAEAAAEKLQAELQQKLIEISGHAQRQAEAIASIYPAFEQLTWADQEREARAYVADNTVDTPILSTIAAERSVTVDYLAGRVIANADAWRVAAATIAGKRQALETAAWTAHDAGDLEALQAVAWESQ